MKTMEDLNSIIEAIPEVEDLDSAQVKQSFRNLATALAENFGPANFDYVFSVVKNATYNYASGFSYCSYCDKKFTDKNKVGEVPRWDAGKNGRGRKFKISADMKLVWPSMYRICLPCALGYLDGIVLFFSQLDRRNQLVLLKALKETVQYQSKYQASSWSLDGVGRKFYTKLSERLMEYVNTRGNRAVDHLTKIMEGCNIITKKEE